VTKALEIEEKTKSIGHSSKLCHLGCTPDLLVHLEPYRDALPFLFIVSSVTGAPLDQVAAGTKGEGIRVKVEMNGDPSANAAGHDPTVGASHDQPGSARDV